MNRILPIFFALLFATEAYGQSVITGRVLGMNDSLPVIAANVMVKTKQGKIAAFASTDIDGKFSLNLKSFVDSMTLTVSMIGYAQYSTPLRRDEHSITIFLDEGSLKLKEVVVKADRIRENGDTVTYSVGAFAEKQDRSIGDVLSRMPGIDVSQSGKIQYQGTDINKFYIEGSDLLGGKYGIATKGIDHEDVSLVEVLENHQSMQVLRGLSFSDQAAINLKLKSKSKASLLVHGELGAGYSEQPHGLIVNASIFAMIIRGEYQNITTLKGNNIGISISDELTDFIIPDPEEMLKPYTGLSVPSTPNLQQKRSYFNRSWYLSTNNLWKTHNGDEIKAQVDYSSNRLEGYSKNTITYFLEGGNRAIVEDKSALSHSNELNGRFIYEANKKTYFLNNTLSTSLGWNDLSMKTDGTLPNRQTTDIPDYLVTNNLKVIKRYGNNRLVTFYSLNQWQSMPEKLTVNPDNGNNYGEKISQHSFYTDERASLGFILNGTTISIETGVTGYFRSLRTGLLGLDFDENNPEKELLRDVIVGRESLTTDYLRVFANPKFEWGHKKIELTVEVPVNLYTYIFSGELSNRTEFFVSPSLRLRYKLNTRSSITLRGSVKRSPASLHDIHDSTILTDYRSFGSGVDDYYAATGQSAGLSYNYRHARYGVFITATGSYGWNRSKFMSVQDVMGDYIFYSYRQVPSRSNNATAMVMASKTLDFIRGAVGLRGNYMWNKRTVLSQGISTRYSSCSMMFNPYINGALTRYLNWSLKYSWLHSMMGIMDVTNRTNDSYVYSGDITVLPCSLLTWTIGSEFYRSQLESGSYKNMTMLDTKLTFNISKKVDLSLSGTNLLNKKSYSYTTFGTLSQLESSTHLLGREFMITVHLKK